MSNPPTRIEAQIDPSRTLLAIAPRFVGLSYETEQVLPGKAGLHYFRADNHALIQLFKTIGVEHLRIGGNSVDRPVTAIPNETDIDHLFAFARAAGVKVIYSVRLQEGDATIAVRTVKHIDERYADLVDCYSIGNEPAYYKPYANFKTRWQPIMEAITQVVPDARFCGPDTNPDPEWCKLIAQEFGAPNGPLSLLTVHNYPGDCSYQNPGAKKVEDLIPKDAEVARTQMLSSAWYPIYSKVHKGMADAVEGTALPFRLAETNNFWYGGLEGASNSFAAALWSAEYLYWWAAHGSAGLNFHTGDRVGGGETSLTSRYTAFVTSGDGYEVRPLSYGMKLFSLGAGDVADRAGALVPIEVMSGEREDVSLYAARTPDGTLTIAIINKSFGESAADAIVNLTISGKYLQQAYLIRLQAHSADIASKTGLTLGGSPIQPDGAWAGQWDAIPTAHNSSSIQLTLPAPSAAVLRIALG